MRKYFLLPHLGLGDQFLMNGFVHYLRTTFFPDEIMIVCKAPQLKTLQELYQEYPIVKFHPIENDIEISPAYGAGPDKLMSYVSQGYHLILFGTHSAQRNYLKLHPTSWASGFYAQHGIPYWMRFSHWHLPPTAQYDALHQQLTQRIGKDYILLHDDPSRDLRLPYEAIQAILQKHQLQNLPIIYLGKDRYNYPLLPHPANNPHVADILKVDSALSYSSIMKNAKACFMMDSSMAILLDMLQPSPQQLRYSYSRYRQFPTQGLYQTVWEFGECLEK
jgi:hypothetical protein